MTMQLTVVENTPSEPAYTLDNLIEGFSDEQLSVIFRNIAAIELTKGCTIGCNFCGVDAQKIKEVTPENRIPYRDIERIVELFGSELEISEPTLYFATDPLDWSDGKFDYGSVIGLFSDELAFMPTTTTAVPKGKENLFLDLLLSEAIIDRVSISHMNYHRLGDFFRDVYPWIDDFMYDLIGTVHSPNFEFNTAIRRTNIPYDDAEPQWIKLIKELQRSDNYIIHSTDGKYRALDFTRLGPKHKGNYSSTGIAAFHGVLMRKDGFYNLESTSPSDNYQFGFSLSKITPDNFSVNHIWYQVYTLPCDGTKNFLDKIRRKGPVDWFVKPVLEAEVNGSNNIESAQNILTTAGYLFRQYQLSNQQNVRFLRNQFYLQWQKYFSNDNVSIDNGSGSDMNDPYQNRVQVAGLLIDQIS